MVTQSLVLFTLKFPYGKGEVFLENEIDILASHFSKVYIVPSNYSTDSQRLSSLPENVSVLQVFQHSDKSVPIVKILLTNFFDAVRVYRYELKSKDKNKYKKYYKSLLHYLALDLRKKKRINKIIDNYNLKDALFYDYWFVNSTITLSLLKREGRINTLVCRAHGFDLYDERQYEKVIPFRNFKLNYLDKVFLISKHGYQYLKERASEEHKHKLELSYLGVQIPKNDGLQPNSNNNQLLFVSCSRLMDFKRVHIIPQVLNKLDISIPIKWVHFGDGPFRNELDKAVAKLNKSIDFDFRGNVPNSEVLAFYQNHYVDFFISLSESEGLPVSMMEAGAYGIPIIATIVNGVGEIVNSETGIPLGLHNTIEQMSASIQCGIQKKFDRHFIKNHFRENFEADLNYTRFAQEVLAIT